MIYATITFPESGSRPYFYTNFVATIDGKVAVKDNPAYWPIGSSKDYETLLELRARADILIHGKTTALHHPTFASLTLRKFLSLRTRARKNYPLIYLVLSNKPTKQLFALLASAPKAIEVMLVTNESARIPAGYSQKVNVIRFGKTKVEIELLSRFLHERGIKRVLVEGGPTTLGSFLAAECLDEIFLTVAPKIFGTKKDITPTLVENYFPKPFAVKQFRLVSVKSVGDEVFLRYRREGLSREAEGVAE